MVNPVDGMNLWEMRPMRYTNCIFVKHAGFLKPRDGSGYFDSRIRIFE